MFCTSCGTELPTDAEFCTECGARNEGEYVVAAATRPTAAATTNRRAGRGKWIAVASLAVIAVALAGTYVYVNRVAKQRVDEVIADLEDKVGLVYTDFSANPLTRSVTLRNITITTIAGAPIDGVSMKSLTVSGDPARDADPQHVDIRVDKLALDLARMGPKWAQLLTMGYGSVVVDTRLDYRYSRNAGEFDLNHLEVAAPDLLTIGMSLHLGNLAADAGSPGEALSRPATTIRSGELMIRDAVLIDRIILMLAEKDHTTPEAYKQQITAMISALFGNGPDKLDNGPAASIVSMINDPRGTVRFTIAPKEPVALSELKKAGDPASQIRLLNLQVSN